MDEIALMAKRLGRYERSTLLRLDKAPQGSEGQMWLALLDNQYLADCTWIDKRPVYSITDLGRKVAAALREKK